MSRFIPEWKTVTYDELLEWCSANKKHLLDEHGIEPEEEAFKEDEIFTYVRECGDAFLAFMKLQGLDVDEQNRVIRYDMRGWNRITAETKAIQEDYEASGNDSPSWDRWNLASDDEVDYYGSYIEIFMELIADYNRHKEDSE